MSNLSFDLLEKAASISNWKFGLINSTNLEDSKLNISPSKKRQAQIAFNDLLLPVDAIYFMGENPFIFFKHLTSFDPQKIQELQRKIWNEGRVPLLSVVTPQEIRFYDCFDIPEKDTNNISRLERGNFQNTQKDLETLGKLLHQSKIDSGTFWEESFGKKIKTNNRVDRKLIENLKLAREILFKNYELPFDIIHDLLGRSLFTLYLEDRKILTIDNYPVKPKGINCFFDLLNFSDATYELFRYLKEKFNGDLFPLSANEEKLIKSNPECLNVVRDCFSGERDLSTNQLSFPWRLFQFQYIPIELISCIYEEFMSEEDEERKTIRKDGAFYTPLMLVEFILNEVLPWPNDVNNNYNLKILDPACGSGIFLVESYKRLIARWKYSNPNMEVNEKILEKILLDNIYGIEKHPEAIKVTAFSLYLTFLNSLEPKRILSQVRFEPLIRWTNGKKIQETDIKRGNNLFHSSTFSQNLDIAKLKFDLIVGNPPWKLGKLEMDVKEYLLRHKLPQQIVCAYLHYMTNFISNGVIALVSSAKVLFNTGSIYERFRHSFFSENDVYAIVNLAVLRDVIFRNAKSPGSVIFYKKATHPLDHEKTITYCTPKNVETIKKQQAIIINAADIKYFPIREIFKKGSKIFKIAMWGNVRDLVLIKKIRATKSIKDTISNKEWGVGLKIKDKTAPFGNPHLSKHLFLPTERIDQFYTSTSLLQLLGNKHTTFRTNNKKIFNTPLIIVKEGTKNAEFCCSFLETDIAFLSSALGISIKDKDEKFHKALVACLNSTLASYYFFLTGSLWGVDKGGQILKEETISFPALPYIMNEKAINKLSVKVDEIIKIKKSTDVELDSKNRIKEIRDQIDETIYEELNITSNEKALINDTLNSSIALHKRYKAYNAEGPVNFNKELIPYVKTMLKTMNSVLSRNKKGVWINVIQNNNTDPLRIICIHLDSPYGNYKVTADFNLTKILSEINAYTYEQHSESIYYRKIIKYYNYSDNLIYLIKPNQKQYWTIAQSLSDSDGILLDLLNK